MLIVLLLTLGVGTLVAAAGLMLATLWSAIPRSNADFEWLDV
ncbi:MAG: hypothetical protein ABI605_15250 [Rhizobacter sp.]